MKALPFAALLLAATPLLPVAAADIEPAVERRTSEDDQVRIDELKVRGQAQRITVKNKSGQLKGSQYEIVPVTPARDPSQPGQTGGQRVWSFSF